MHATLIKRKKRSRSQTNTRVSSAAKDFKDGFLVRESQRESCGRMFARNDCGEAQTQDFKFLGRVCILWAKTRTWPAFFTEGDLTRENTGLSNIGSKIEWDANISNIQVTVTELKAETQRRSTKRGAARKQEINSKSTSPCSARSRWQAVHRHVIVVLGQGYTGFGVSVGQGDIQRWRRQQYRPRC